jgi:hypothetical protein
MNGVVPLPEKGVYASIVYTPIRILTYPCLLFQNFSSLLQSFEKKIKASPFSMVQIVAEILGRA